MKGDGSIFLRGKTYWMKFYREGLPVSMSCKTASKDAAKTKLRNELRKSDEDFTEPRFKRITVAEVFNVYLDRLEAEGKDDYRKLQLGRWNNHLKPVFGDMKAAKLDSETQHKYRKARIAAGAATATINREMEILATAFKLGYQMQPPLVKRMPKFHYVAEDNARRVFATPEQIAAIKRETINPANYKRCYKVTPLHARAFVEIAHMFGWRFSEVLNLKAENIHLPDNTIRIEDSKNGDAREVSMTPAIRTLIDALLVGKQQHDRLFPFSNFAMWNTWLKIVKAAGCEHLHIHDLRRTSARSKRAAGVDTSVTMAIMGWKTERMFRRYGIVAKDDIASAMAKQENYEQQLQTAAAAPGVN